ncbi:MAG: hypothetical protein F6K57_38610 [Moorea sp. SIO4A5]|nr:hypothetical protein [Moorena sp. SIO4A5]
MFSPAPHAPHINGGFLFVYFFLYPFLKQSDRVPIVKALGSEFHPAPIYSMEQSVDGVSLFGGE